MEKRQFQDINLSITILFLFFLFEMIYLVWFDFVRIITLNWLIFSLHKVQKSSYINMSFD